MDRAKLFPLLKGVLVLAVIALCSGLLLGIFNHITYVDPLQSAYDRFAADTGKTFSEMTDRDGKDYANSSIVYYAVSDDGTTHAFLAEGQGGRFGAVQVYVYVAADGTVEKVEIGENSENYWDLFEGSGFYDQFIGQNIATLDPLDADAVSGATYSSTAIKNALDAVVQYYNELTEEESYEQA